MTNPYYQHFKLTSNAGCSRWLFQPPAQFFNANWEGDLSHKQEEFLKELSAAFTFDKSKNPNSSDAVYRAQCAENNNTTITSDDTLTKGWQYYKRLQTTDGNWPGDYGGPMFLLPGLVIAAYVTDTPFAAPHRELMKRYMLNHQREDGGWGLHLEGHSTMFGTVLQYVSLRLLGMPADAPACEKARTWIHANAGATNIPSWGKFYLSVLGVFEWEGCNSLFPEMWLLPKWLPIHPSRYWCHTRMVYLPMAYCYGHRFSKPLTDLTHAIRNEIYTSPYSEIKWSKVRNSCSPTDVYFPQAKLLKWMNAVLNLYEKMPLKFLRKSALDFCLEYINAEDEQTNFIDIGPVNQVINSLAVFHAYGKNSEQFQQHVQRWFDYLWLAEDGMKMQGYNGSQLWDTAFAAQALKESSCVKKFPDVLANCYRYIEASQILHEVRHREKFFRHQQIGGWPFSTLAHGWPITDCTAEGLKVLLDARPTLCNMDDTRFQQAVDVLLSYQNKDGGWATYENTRAPKWLEKLNPAELFGNIMIDYSYVECSSACLQALVKFTKQFPTYRNYEIIEAVTRGLNFILKEQRSDGSWYGSWAVCFTYGGWFAVEALTAVNSLLPQYTACIQTAFSRYENFLLQHQHAETGWGESFQSCVEKKYVQAATSQIVNSAWAVLALLRMNEYTELKNETKVAIDKAIALIKSRQLPNGDFPQENISGVFNHNCMITYTAYRNIFPLWALARYENHKVITPFVSPGMTYANA